MARTISADAVASYILKKAHEAGDLMTHLRLQKLVYYVQAWHLAIAGEKIFPERFQAWVHGPVEEGLYRRFRHYGWQPIMDAPSDPELPDAVTAFIDEVLDAYGGFTAWELERMTHAEDPWIKARGDLAPDDASQTYIDETEMRDFYRSRMN